MSNIDVPQTTLSSSAVAPKAIETAPVNRASGTMQIASVLDQLACPPLLGENEPAIASSQKSLEIALKDVNSTLATSNTNLSFTVDPSSNRTYKALRIKLLLRYLAALTRQVAYITSCVCSQIKVLLGLFIVLSRHFCLTEVVTSSGGW